MTENRRYINYIDDTVVSTLEEWAMRDSVKATADYVTDSVDEDGIENALRHFGLIG